MPQEPYPSLPRTVGLLLVTLLLAGALAVATMVLFPDWPEIARMALPTEIALLVAIGYAVRRTGLPWHRALMLGGFDTRVLVPLALVLIGSVTVFSELYLVMQKIIPVPAGFEQALEKLLEISGPVDFAVTTGVAVLIAPVLEEALFRGVLLQGIARRRGPRSAVVWTALFFALFHLYNPWQMLPTFFLGLILAWVVLNTRTLWTGIALHGAFNAVSLALFAAPVDQASRTVPIGWFLVGIVAFLLAGSVALLGGMMWIERLTGGGWFEDGTPDAEEPAELADLYAGERAPSGVGPPTTRG